MSVPANLVKSVKYHSMTSESLFGREEFATVEMFPTHDNAHAENYIYRAHGFKRLIHTEPNSFTFVLDDAADASLALLPRSSTLHYDETEDEQTGRYDIRAFTILR